MLQDITLTHDLKGSDKKELLSHICSSPVHIVDFTYSFGSFMLPNPEPVKKASFNKFKLGEITGSLRRINLYEDR